MSYYIGLSFLMMFIIFAAHLIQALLEKRKVYRLIHLMHSNKVKTTT